MVFDIERVEQSFQVISPRLDELTLIFYNALFVEHPELKPLFLRVDLIRQRRKLAAMLTLVVTTLRRMDVLVSTLRSLGSRHTTYGATDESYAWVTQILLRSLGTVAGETWDEATEQAWKGAIQLVVGEMKVGQAAGEDQLAQGEDLDLLMEIASNPALSFKRNSLFASYVEKKKRDHEMELARSVQQNLIRLDFPSLPDYRLSASYEPAAQVGGDYLEWIMDGHDHICFSFGDVAGKGLPGALVMCRLSGAAHALLATERDMARAVTMLNAHMCHGMTRGRFVTFALLRLNLRTHHYTLVNAGHVPPLVRRADGTAEYHGQDEAGIPIGIDPSVDYKSVEGTLEPGDSLLLFTDGVSEALGANGELYGMERVRLCACATADPAMIGSKLLDDVRQFSAGRPQSDDVTILTVSRLG